MPELFDHNLGFLHYTGKTLRTYAEKKRGWRWDMSQVVHAHRNCTRNLPGRFWMTHHNFLENISFFEGHQLRDVLGDMAQSERAYSVCAPLGCSELMVRDVVIPVFWLVHVYASIHKIDVMQAVLQWRGNFRLNSKLSVMLQRFELPVIRHSVHVTVEELSGWDELDVAWAILGFYGTGTSSLAMNLHAHPELELLYEREQYVVWEEHFFLYGRISHLPPRTEALAFNKWHTKPAGPQPRLRGVKRAGYIMSPAALSRLAHVPRLVALVVVQDPLEMLERQYLRAIGKCFEQGDRDFQPPRLDSCVGAVACAVRCSGVETQVNLDPERLMVVKGLRSAAATFGRHRLLVVDTEELNHGHAFYDAAAAFVGAAKPFPADMSFGRANVHPDSRWSVEELRAMVQALPGGTDGLTAGRAALLELLGPERRALRALLIELPSARPRGVLPLWARSL